MMTKFGFSAPRVVEPTPPTSRTVSMANRRERITFVAEAAKLPGFEQRAGRILAHPVTTFAEEHFARGDRSLALGRVIRNIKVDSAERRVIISVS
jgi:hypothetical protein